MRHSRPRVVFVLASFLLGMQPMAAPATPSGVVVLRGVNKFTASSAMSVLVELRRPTAVPADLAITYDGDGRVQGYVMIKQGVPVSEAPRLESQTLGQCSTRGCHSRRHDDIFTSGTNFGRKLPAGTYRLYLIADHAPVTVKIRLDDVKGTTSTRPSQPYKLAVRTLNPRSDLTPTHNVYSAGDFRPAAHKGALIGFVGLWLSGPAGTIGAAGDCFYRESNQQQGHSFAPGCPTGDSTGPWVFSGSDSRGNLFATTTDWDSPSGLGVWFASGSIIKRYGAVGFWMTP